jgi:hypothetical protein
MAAAFAPWVPKGSWSAVCRQADADCACSTGAVVGIDMAPEAVADTLGQSSTMKAPDFFVISILHSMDPIGTFLWTTSNELRVEPLLGH